MVLTFFHQIILGKKVKRPAVLDERVANELLQHICPDDTFEVASGITLCTDDFYEGEYVHDSLPTLHDIGPLII